MTKTHFSSNPDVTKTCFMKMVLILYNDANTVQALVENHIYFVLSPMVFFHRRLKGRKKLLSPSSAFSTFFFLEMEKNVT